jgi:hypothetical protein
MMFALALAVCQLVTLVLLWPRPTPQAGPPAVVPLQQPVEQPAPTPPVDPSEWLALKSRAAISADTDLPPSASAGPLVPDEPALSVSTIPANLFPD